MFTLELNVFITVIMPRQGEVADTHNMSVMRTLCVQVADISSLASSLNLLLPPEASIGVGSDVDWKSILERRKREEEKSYVNMLIFSTK